MLQLTFVIRQLTIGHYSSSTNCFEISRLDHDFQQSLASTLQDARVSESIVVLRTCFRNSCLLAGVARLEIAYLGCYSNRQKLIQPLSSVRRREKKKTWLGEIWLSSQRLHSRKVCCEHFSDWKKMLTYDRVFNSIREKILTLNLYESRSSNPIVIRRQILSTRLFTVLLAISILILLIYTSLSQHVRSQTIQSPTYSLYKQLEHTYLNSLQCPCEKVSIPYGKFVNISLSFHQVCNSDFVLQSWIDFTFVGNLSLIWPMDVRTVLSSMWQLIGSLCRSSIIALTSAFNDFIETPMINSIMLDSRLFETQIQAVLDSVRETTFDSVIRPLNLIYQLTHVNDYVTGLSTNYIATLTYPENEIEERRLFRIMSTRVIERGSTKTCYCQHDKTCSMVGGLYFYDAQLTKGLYDMNKISSNETLPGFVVDCLPIQTMFASSLECFYNETCLEILLSSYEESINVSVLNETLSSRFSRNTKIEVLVNELFLEIMQNEKKHRSYFEECAPITCSYTYSESFDWLSTVPTLIAVFGGLSTVLRVISPYLLKLFFYVKRKRGSTSVEHPPRPRKVEIRSLRLLLFQ